MNIYFYILFLMIVFFLYGLILSLFIDFLFPDFINNQYEYIVFIETLFELGVVYCVYFFMRQYMNSFIGMFIPKNNIPFLPQILLFAFSYGIYFYLKKYSQKIKYFQHKYVFNPIKKHEYYKKVHSNKYGRQLIEMIIK